MQFVNSCLLYSMLLWTWISTKYYYMSIQYAIVLYHDIDIVIYNTILSFYIFFCAYFTIFVKTNKVEVFGWTLQGSQRYKPVCSLLVHYVLLGNKCYSPFVIFLDISYFIKTLRRDVVSAFSGIIASQ
ncbi:hypothetical protein QTP88_005238 [Uroleucon formosanum]